MTSNDRVSGVTARQVTRPRAYVLRYSSDLSGEGIS